MYTPGPYRVPVDIPDLVAEEMLGRLDAVRIETPERGGEAMDSVRSISEAADLLPSIEPRFGGQTVVVAGSGPSLTAGVAAACRGVPVIAVNDAYRLFPDAVLLYACDADWWDVHGGCPDFAGEKWSSHSVGPKRDDNDKREVARKYGLTLIEGRAAEGFSLDPSIIHYGSNSGFQAVNLAILFGATRIVLVGFDMRAINGRRHFFGDHPTRLRNRSGYASFVRAFERAAKTLPANTKIINAAPDSSLKCFLKMELQDALTKAP
jgi:hypothetical protein